MKLTKCMSGGMRCVYCAAHIGRGEMYRCCYVKFPRASVCLDCVREGARHKKDGVRGPGHLAMPTVVLADGIVLHPPVPQDMVDRATLGGDSAHPKHSGTAAEHLERGRGWKAIQDWIKQHSEKARAEKKMGWSKPVPHEG